MTDNAMTTDAMRKLRDDIVGIQEDLPSEDDRNVLGMAAHYIEKYAASLSAKTDRDGWQPIENAPKDGTRIQLLSVRSINSETLPGILWIKVGSWCAHYQDGYAEGWRENAVAGPHEPRIRLVPSHWQPMPSLPLKSPEQEGPKP